MNIMQSCELTENIHSHVYLQFKQTVNKKRAMLQLTQKYPTIWSTKQLNKYTLCLTKRPVPYYFLNYVKINQF